MNIFSNIGVTELILILLLALLVVGPERLPELGRKLGKFLRDVRKMYENLSRDLEPELRAMQEPIQELRESVDSIRSIPQDLVQTVVKAADLGSTLEELQDVTGSVVETRQTLASAGKAIADPVGAALGAAQAALKPGPLAGPEIGPADTAEVTTGPTDLAPLEQQEAIEPSRASAAETAAEATEHNGAQGQPASSHTEAPAHD